MIDPRKLFGWAALIVVGCQGEPAPAGGSQGSSSTGPVETGGAVEVTTGTQSTGPGAAETTTGQTGGPVPTTGDEAVSTQGPAGTSSEGDGPGTGDSSSGTGGEGIVDSPWVPPDYALVFNDEFEGAQLDTSKWWTRYVYSAGMLDHLNDEQQLYREKQNHVMTGDTLELTAYKVADNGPKAINYESGMIRSKVLMKYGYFEARVKMPPAIGVWPAFWLNAETPPWPPEIDIFEYVNNGVEDKANMIHTGVVNHGAQGGEFLFVDPKFNKQWTFWTAPFNFPDEYHVISVLWDETSAATFVDGQMIVKRGYKWVHDNGEDAGYAHVLVNLAIGGEWAGRHGIADELFPQALAVDYVRVYQKDKDISTSVVGHELCPPEGGC